MNFEDELKYLKECQRKVKHYHSQLDFWQNRFENQAKRLADEIKRHDNRIDK